MKIGNKIDSKKIADLMRSNHLPIGYVYPKEMRSTRNLLRRRIRFTKIRAEAYAHFQTIFRQNSMNITPNDVKDKKNRRELINRFSDSSIQSNIELNLDIIDFFDPKLNKIERQIRAQAKEYDRTTHNLLLTVPGIGDMISLVILYEIGNISRFESAQKFSSYSRLVKCERESGEKNIMEVIRRSVILISSGL